MSATLLLAYTDDESRRFFWIIPCLYMSETVVYFPFLATPFDAAVLMHLVFLSLIQEASMSAKEGKQRVVTADSIRKASEVSMPTSFDI